MAPMLPDGRRLGAHLPLGAGMVRAVERAHEIGASTMQVFSDNPTAWKRRAAPPPELPAFRARVAEHDIAPLAIHGSYLLNLAGPDPELFARSIELLAAELRDARGYGARFVNIHIGSHRGAGIATGIERLAEGVARTFERTAEPVDAAEGRGGPGDAVTRDVADEPAPMLVLENSAGSGWGIGVDLDELTSIAEAVERRGVAAERVGFCLDTAHAWGAGIDLSSPKAIDGFLARFDARIGLGRLVMVHLNDSKAELGSRLDRHEHIGAGRIGELGLGHLVRHPDLRHAAYLLETPGMQEGYDAINMARVRALASGEPLDALPPEAFELAGGSRARTAPA